MYTIAQKIKSYLPALLLLCISLELKAQAPEQPASEEETAPKTPVMRKIETTGALVRNYELDFNAGNQETRDFPVFHWGLKYNSTWRKEFEYLVNLNNYYASLPSAFLYSTDFFTIDALVRYRTEYYTFVQGGPFIIARSFNFDNDFFGSLGVSPLAGVGFFYEFPYKINAEFAVNFVWFSDGLWFEWQPKINWKFSTHTSFYISYQWRLSYADKANVANIQRQSIAKIPQIGIVFYW